MVNSCYFFELLSVSIVSIDCLILFSSGDRPTDDLDNNRNNTHSPNADVSLLSP